MLFKDYHIPLIRAGEKTVTRRDWADSYPGPNVGSIIPATTEMFVKREEADCFIRVTDRYEQPLGLMTTEDAQAEGDYESISEFKESFEEIYGWWDPDKVVEVVEFEYMGRSLAEVEDVLDEESRPEHYIRQHPSWEMDSFGCTHQDEEVDMSGTPDFCPFCGVSLGTEDIEVREWPPEEGE